MTRSPSLPRLSRRLDAVHESTTLRLNALVKKMIQAGEDVINLTAGEPDFAVPESVKEAVKEALNRNQSKYTPVPGIEELRRAVAQSTNLLQPRAAKTKPWTGSDVVVSNGGKHALFDTFLCLLNPGEEVVIPSPYWLSYPDMVQIAGGVPVFIKTGPETQFKITPSLLKKALGPNVKALVLNSPSNPTGMMYSMEEFQALGEILCLPENQNVWVVSDEIYDQITFGEVEYCSFLNAVPELRDRVVTVNGLSKSAAMTGWRVGWTLAPPDLTEMLIRLQGQSTSGINSLAQWASVEALKLPGQHFIDQQKIFKRRRDLALEILSKSGKIVLTPPQGAFYFFLGVAQCFEDGEDAAGFSERILREAKVAVVPGNPFGDSNYIRISFATDDQLLQEGCRRFIEFIERKT